MAAAVIIGTAGHIDHGKTSLVRALTGVDTDRLPEEKRRGITIELGFAPIELPGVGRAGVVDVPGHEGFVRMMLAGATGIDVALLVIAADEGVMPQTREHLAILTLLGVRGGVVAITKSDLVEDEWLALVTDDVRNELHGSPLAEAPIIPTAVPGGVGLDDVRAALAESLRALPERDARDVARLPVDRAFTVRGTGTVVTGTVWSGEISLDDTLWVLPERRAVRVRGIQVHGESVARAGPGMRAAIALAGIDVAQVGRGSTLVGHAAWAPAHVLRADVALLESLGRLLRPRERVRLHLGTSDIGARVVVAGGAFSAGEVRGARLVLDEPVAARAGDRFVLRGGSPLTTLGGGIVVDAAPPLRRARPWVTGLASEPGERLALILAEGEREGVLRETLPVRLGVNSAAIEGMLRALDVQSLGPLLFSPGTVERGRLALADAVREYHRGHPLEPGIPAASLRAALGVAPVLAEELVRRALASEALESEGGLVRLRGWRPTLSEGQDVVRHRLLQHIGAAGAEPPTVTELGQEYGNEVAALLRILERDGLVVQVESDRYYEAATLRTLIAQLTSGMVPGREYSPSELREFLGVSRKYLIPFLEFCDRTGVTDRRGNGRLLRGVNIEGRFLDKG